jgi:hypothetical protein
MEDMPFSLKCIGALNPLLVLQGVNFNIKVFIVTAIKYLCKQNIKIKIKLRNVTSIKCDSIKFL